MSWHGRLHVLQHPFRGHPWHGDGLPVLGTWCLLVVVTLTWQLSELCEPWCQAARAYRVASHTMLGARAPAALSMQELQEFLPSAEGAFSSRSSSSGSMAGKGHRQGQEGWEEEALGQYLQL